MMISPPKLCASVVILLLLACLGAAQTARSVVPPPDKAQPVRIARFSTPPTIDGKLDEEIWKSAPVLKDFFQTRPGDNIAPSRATEFMIGYDAKFLYIAFHAYDEPHQVRATVAKRDAIFDDDNVGVLLDTFNDKRKAYEFFFNPFGIQADAINSIDRGEDFSVDIVMESKGSLTEDGYVVEAAIPFKSLRYEAGKEKPWGIHVFRFIKRFNNEQNSWMPLSRERADLLSQSGQIVGFEDIATERNLEIIPSLTVSETGKRIATRPATASGSFFNQPVDLDPGLSVKLGLTSTVTLDFAINPDFAQVEADATVVRANQRFPIFFPERRPFFLEGIDIFNTPLSTFNTRAIVDPDYAVKLTGKRGRDSFGVVLASDNAPGNFSREEINDPDLFPRIARFVDKNAYIGVLRYKRDVGKDSNLGFIATSYNFIEKHNNVAGIDGFLRRDPKTFFKFQVLGTTSRTFFFDPDRGRSIFRTGNGIGYLLNYDYTGRNFGYFVTSEGRTRDFRADVGFTRRVNTNFSGAFVRLSTDPKANARLINTRLITVANINYDMEGRVQRWVVSPELSLSLARQTFVGFGYRSSNEKLYEDEFGAKRRPGQPGAFFGRGMRDANQGSGFVFFETNPSKRYSGFVVVSQDFGTFDFDFGAGPKFPRVSPAALADPNAPLDPGPGRFFAVDAGITYQPTDGLRASLNYIKNRLTRDDTGRVAFDVNIFSLRATYQFTRFTFARARIDYDTLSQRALGLFLVGWTPNPGTSFFVGYNDDLTVRGFSPFTGEQQRGFRRNGRTFFIKMSYLIRRSL